MTATTRLGIPLYADSEDASFSAQVNAISDKVDEKAAEITQGTYADRPSASVQRRYYLATDGTVSGCAEGDLYYDTGSAWEGPRNAATAVPIGSITFYAGESAPEDHDGVTRWLKCNGAAISRSTYSKLFDLIGGTYGTGNGSTTFNLPNLTGRVPVPPGASGVSAIGSTGGEEDHTLTEAEMPSHHHTYYRGSEYGVANFSRESSEEKLRTTGNEGTTNTSSAGGGDGHNNMQPYLGLNALIRVL